MEVQDRERLRLRERPDEPPVMRQRWQRLALLHWSVDPQALASLLPPGLELDTWEGKAYVGIVPFSIVGTRPPLLPPLPGLSSFLELNLRTYVHRRGRDPGVWFFSLDAASRVAVSLARMAYKLPYHHARMAMTQRADGGVSFSSRRVGSDAATLTCDYDPTGSPLPARVGTLPFFLIERYLLYSWDGSLLRSARVWHQPYPVQPATVTALEQGVSMTEGLPALVDPPLVHYSHDLAVRIYRPRPVGERPRQWVPVTTPLGTAIAPEAPLH
jgi:uncharacterized protein YqjF (DUF2071 family)